jgi:hypothetical protein
VTSVSRNKPDASIRDRVDGCGGVAAKYVPREEKVVHTGGSR